MLLLMFSLFVKTLDLTNVSSSLFNFRGRSMEDILVFILNVRDLVFFQAYMAEAKASFSCFLCILGIPNSCVYLLRSLFFSFFVMSLPGVISIPEKAADIFSSFFGTGSMSVVNITGVPRWDMYLMISEWRKSFLLLVEMRFPFRSSKAIPVVVPGSIPTMRSLFSVRITPP